MEYKELEGTNAFLLVEERTKRVIAIPFSRIGELFVVPVGKEWELRATLLPNGASLLLGIYAQSGEALAALENATRAAFGKDRE